MRRRLEFDNHDSASWCFTVTFGALFGAMVLYCLIVGLANGNLRPEQEADEIVRAKIKVEEGNASLTEKVMAQKAVPPPPAPIIFSPKEHPYIAISIGLLALTVISSVWADGLTLRERKDVDAGELRAVKKQVLELEGELQNYRFRFGEFSEDELPSAVRKD